MRSAHYEHRSSKVSRKGLCHQVPHRLTTRQRVYASITTYDYPSLEEQQHLETVVSFIQRQWAEGQAMPSRLTTVRISVRDPSADAPEVERLAGLLREELLDLDVEDVLPQIMGGAPAGAKAIELVELGTLLVTLAKSGGLLSQIAGLVRSWVARNDRLAVSLEVGDAKIVIDGATSGERRQLIDAWITQALRQPATP